MNFNPIPPGFLYFIFGGSGWGEGTWNNVYKPKPLKAFSSLLLTFTNKFSYWPFKSDISPDSVKKTNSILPPVQTANISNFWGKLIFKKIYTPPFLSQPFQGYAF